MAATRGALTKPSKPPTKSPKSANSSKTGRGKIQPPVRKFKPARSNIFNPLYVLVFLGLFAIVGIAAIIFAHAATLNPFGDVASWGSWNMVFSDEFDGASLDTSKWATNRGYAPGYGDPFNPTQEGAYFLNDNVSVANGSLALTLKKGVTNNYAYSSGMVQSGRSFGYQYGYAEARIKVPNCAGCWPAYWFLDQPLDDHWPPEIDAFEFFDTSTNKQPNFNYHWADSAGNLKQSGPTPYGNSSIDYTADYHVYGMYWSPTLVQVFIDGKAGPTYTDAATITKAKNYVVLNLSAYKNTSPASGSQMLVDYVRIWQSGAVTPTSDTTAPTANITTPVKSATVSGKTVSVTATASDNSGGSGMKQIDYYIDNVYKSTAVSPYTWTWDSTTASNGTHAVKAVPIDVAGNYGESSVSVNVSNTATAPVTNSYNDNTTGTGQNQFKFSGRWSHGAQTGAFKGDNHWSGSANSYYSVAFSGTQAALYASKANSNGIAAISIDGGAETMVDLYASSRTDNTLIYTSPTLTNGSHTIKVRATGNKNARAIGKYIPADRIDIISVK